MGFNDDRHDHGSGGSGGTELNPREVKIGRDIALDTVPYTIYVRSAGSDSNGGLSESEPLATVGEALDRVPRIAEHMQDGVVVEIDIESGATFSASNLNCTTPHIPRLRLTSSGASNAVLSVGANEKRGINFNKTRVILEDITVQPADTTSRPDHCIEGRHHSHVVLSGSTLLKGAGAVQFRLDYQSRGEVRPNVEIQGPGKGTSAGVHVHASSFCSVNGTIRDCQTGFSVDRASGGLLVGTADNCVDGVRAQDVGAVKIANDPNGNAPALTNCDYGVTTEDGAAAKLIDAPDFTGTGQGVRATNLGIMLQEYLNTPARFIGVPGGSNPVEFRNNGNSPALGIRGNGPVSLPNAVEFAGEDLTARNGNQNDELAMHDGSGTPARGLYRWEDGNLQWVKVEDNTVTI